MSAVKIPMHNSTVHCHSIRYLLHRKSKRSYLNSNYMFGQTGMDILRTSDTDTIYMAEPGTLSSTCPYRFIMGLHVFPSDYIPLLHQIADLLLPHEDEEDEHSETDVGDVNDDPVPVGAAHGETQQFYRPVHSHHHEQLEVQAIPGM